MKQTTPCRLCDECGAKSPLNTIQLAHSKKEIRLCDSCTWELEEQLFKKIPNPTHKLVEVEA